MTTEEIDAVADLALVEAVEERVALLGLGLLEIGAAGEDDVVAGPVELDHLGCDALTDERVEITNPAQVDQRGREESAETDVDDETTLDHLDDGALDGAAFLGDLLDPAPGALVHGALLGEDEPALFVLFVEDDCLDPLTHVDRVVGVDVVSDRELAGGYEAFGLVADVDHRPVGVDADDGALDDVALLELEHRGLDGALEVVADVIGKVAQIGGDEGLPAGNFFNRRRGLVGSSTSAGTVVSVSVASGASALSVSGALAGALWCSLVMCGWLPPKETL